MADMTRAHGRRRKQFSPYRYEPYEFETSVRSLTLDGEDALPKVDAENQKISLGDVEEWGAVTICLDAELSKSTLQEVLPDEELDSPPIEGVLIVQDIFGRQTYLRNGVSMTIDEEAEAEIKFTCKVRLQRGDLRGKVLLRPVLVRASERAGKPGYASDKGARLVGGHEWSIILDSALPPGAYLEARYEDFTESESRYLRNNSHLIYFLDLEERGSPSRPILWLNEDIADLRIVFDSNGTRGAKARVRDVIFDAISIPVVSSLIIRAALDCDLDSLEAPYEWEDGILSQFADELYPEDEGEDAKRILVDTVREPEGITQVMERINSVIQRRHNMGSNLEKLFREALG